jgi:hypothetical protein
MSIRAAERLLQDLGVTEPAEIDLEAIAYDRNCQVRVRPLSGCEGRIVGHGDRAIISVNSNSPPRRRRFSIAHELGHWHYHRGQCLACRAEVFQPGRAPPTEKIADGYAADLLMPDYLFKPALLAIGKLTFKAIGAVADRFDVSRTAAAIRLVERDCAPAFVVCHGPGGRKWFVRAAGVPSRWFPREELDAESFAFDVLNQTKTDDSMPHKIGAEAWFDRSEAQRYEIHEQTIRTGPDEVLSLLLLADDRMLDEGPGRRWSGR